MPSDSLSQFLDQLHNSQLLNAGQIEELIRRPEMPHGDIESVGAFIEQRGWLTRFQIERLREGRGGELQVEGGYRLTDLLDESPTATTYKAMQLALQRHVVLRLIHPEALSPYDNAADYLSRVHAITLLSHPHLINSLDSGSLSGRPYVATEYVTGGDLGSLVRGMGAMPLTLACDYVFQAANAMQVAHERGIAHGELTPALLMITPVVQTEVGLQPGPGARVKVAGLGLNPRRPLLESTTIVGIGYRPPERLLGVEPQPAGDIFALGGVLYFLLTGQPPFPAASLQDAMQKIRTADPQPLEGFRPDVPPPVAGLVRRMLAKSPELRPDARQVAETLRAFFGAQSTAVGAKPTSVNGVPIASLTNTRFDDDFPLAAEIPLAGPPTGIDLGASANSPGGLAMAEVVEDDAPAAHAMPMRGFTPAAHAEPVEHHPDMFSQTHHEDEDETPRQRPSRKAQNANMTLWLVLGALLHGTAIVLLLGWALGWFSGGSEPKPTQKQQNSTKYPKPPR